MKPVYPSREGRKPLFVWVKDDLKAWVAAYSKRQRRTLQSTMEILIEEKRKAEGKR